MARVSKQSEQFVLRLPDGMRDKIKAAAEVNGRSMNSEIVATLEDAYPEVDPEAEILDLLHHVHEIAMKKLPKDKLEGIDAMINGLAIEVKSRR